MLAEMEVLPVRRRVSHCCTFTRIVRSDQRSSMAADRVGTEFCLHCFPQQK